MEDIIYNHTIVEYRTYLIWRKEAKLAHGRMWANTRARGANRTGKESIGTYDLDLKQLDD